MYGVSIWTASRIVQLLIVLVFSCEGECNSCAPYGNHYFACINDCGCGACGDHCLPADESGKPASGCSKSAWSTNAHSLSCAIHDDTVGPILTALFSTLVATLLVIFIIFLLQLIHKGCSFVLRRRRVDPHHVICDVWPEHYSETVVI